MEISPEMGKYVLDLGVFAIGHLGILGNRLRNNRSKLDVYVEHVVSHSLRPLYFVGVIGLINQTSESLTSGQAALAGSAWGIVIDGVIPPIREKSIKAIQWDQIAANLFGTAIYLAVAHAFQ